MAGKQAGTPHGLKWPAANHEVRVERLALQKSIYREIERMVTCKASSIAAIARQGQPYTLVASHRSLLLLLLLDWTWGHNKLAVEVFWAMMAVMGMMSSSRSS